MFHRATLVLAVCFVATSLFAQGKPAQPGPPSTTPQVVVDSTGKTVGEVLDITPGLKSAHVKYVLPNGDFVVLNGGVQALAAGSRIDPWTNYYGTPEHANVFFMDSTCQGDAYVLMGTNNVTYNELMTPSQAQTIDGVYAPQLPPPPIGGSCPMPYGMETWLYTRKTSGCPFQADPGHTITFQAFYGIPQVPNPSGPSGMCVPITGGYTFPDATHPFGAFVTFTPVENLSLKFTPPFSIK